MGRGPATRIEALELYGSKCRCCGEAWLPYLVFDHVSGGGTAHRAALKSGSHRVAAWVLRAYRDTGRPPESVQVLCANCNQAKEKGGCPDHGYLPEELPVMATAPTLTNRELGDLVGLTHSSISRIRSGTRIPSSDVMLQIERVFGWPIDEQIRARSKYAAEFERRVVAYVKARSAAVPV